MTKLNMRKLNKAWRKKMGRSSNGVKLSEKLSVFIKSHGKQVPKTKAAQVELVNALMYGPTYSPPAKTKKGKRAKAHRSQKQSARSFYASWEWKKLRFATLERLGRRCMCCGWSPEDGTKGHLCVDHIKPRSKYPHLELEPSNMQVLCNSCNMGKSNTSEARFDAYEDPEPEPHWMDSAFSATIQ